MKNSKNSYDQMSANELYSAIEKENSRSWPKYVAMLSGALLLRWTAFYARLLLPVFVLGYFYYSITQHWHFVFIHILLLPLWGPMLYKGIELLTDVHRYADLWISDGFDSYNDCADNLGYPKIPEFVDNGNLSKVLFLAILVLGFSTGKFSEFYNWWCAYPLPAKDPVAGFFHFFFIYF